MPILDRMPPLFPAPSHFVLSFDRPFLFSFFFSSSSSFPPHHLPYPSIFYLSFLHLPLTNTFYGWFIHLRVLHSHSPPNFPVSFSSFMACFTNILFRIADTFNRTFRISRGLIAGASLFQTIARTFTPQRSRSHDKLPEVFTLTEILMFVLM